MVQIDVTPNVTRQKFFPTRAGYGISNVTLHIAPVRLPPR